MCFIFQKSKQKQNGVVFNGPCSQNDECSKGSCCLPNGNCFEGTLTTEFIIECKEAVREKKRKGGNSNNNNSYFCRKKNQWFLFCRAFHRMFRVVKLQTDHALTLAPNSLRAAYQTERARTVRSHQRTRKSAKQTVRRRSTQEYVPSVHHFFFSLSF